LLAFALWAGPYRLSQREAADLADANVTYLSTLAALTPEQRRQVALRQLTLSSIVNRNRPRREGCPSLIEQLKAATPDERLEAARAIGIRAVWEEMCVPILDEEPAA